MDEHETKKDSPEGSISRRYFLELLGIGSLMVSAVGAAILSVEYLSPNVLFEPPMKFKAGMLDQFEPGSVTRLPEQKVYIVRSKEGYFYAMSDICTHLGCITNWQAGEGIIACPCHGSRFDIEGNVIHGPAPRSLQRYLLTRTEPGELVVDKGQIVEQNTVLKV